MGRSWWSLVLLGMVGCFIKPPRPDVTADGRTDGNAVDAFVCTPVSVECVSSTTLRTTCTGEAPIDTTCGWGCSTAGGAHCAKITPAANAVTSSDLDPTGLGDVTLGSVVIDADAGSITGVTSGFDHHITTSQVTVFRFKSLDITGTVTFTGSHAIALVADGEITVGGLIDARGDCIGGDAGPGGWAGGADDTVGGGLGGGPAGSSMQGGGGGGYGGSGGGGSTSSAHGAGGSVFGVAMISTLTGGSGGGGAGDMAHLGGGGGGAVQLVSNSQILVSGGINAGGCGGHGGSGSVAGGGGGAGGTVLLEAPSVTVVGTLAANGGGGGGGDAGGHDGSAGTLDRTPAPGGGVASGAGVGGTGAAGATANGGDAGLSSRGGGGGGGIGRIRINTLTGVVPMTGVLSPGFGDPSPVSTGVATFQ